MRASSTRAVGRQALAAGAALALGSAVLLPSAGHAGPPVTVTNAWFRYLLPQVPAGGYMTLKNASAQPLILIGASSVACRMLMLHRSERQGGMERMVEVRHLTVPARGAVHFAPGGYHLMCMQPKMRPGQIVQVTLRFQDGGTITAAFSVYAMGQHDGG